jgi:hypothetical protein
MDRGKEEKKKANNQNQWIHTIVSGCPTAIFY